MAFVPAYVPQTELDAVNQMLMSIGQAPLNTLAVTGIKDAQFAQLVLHNSLREVLTKGWFFNTDEEYELLPDVDGKIAIPATALSVDPSLVNHSKFRGLVERYEVIAEVATRRFYDREDHTFVIGETVLVDITWLFPYEQIPQAARAYIAHYAGRVFQTSQVGSELLYKFTKEREMELLGELQREDRRTSDSNFLDSDTRIFNTRHRN